MSHNRPPDGETAGGGLELHAARVRLVDERAVGGERPEHVYPVLRSHQIGRGLLELHHAEARHQRVVVPVFAAEVDEEPAFVVEAALGVEAAQGHEACASGRYPAIPISAHFEGIATFACTLDAGGGHTLVAARHEGQRQGHEERQGEEAEDASHRNQHRPVACRRSGPNGPDCGTARARRIVGRAKGPSPGVVTALLRSRRGRGSRQDGEG